MKLKILEFFFFFILIVGNLLDLRDGKAELSGRVLKRTSTFIKRLISAFQNRVKCPVLNKDFSDGGQAAGIIASVCISSHPDAP